MKVENITLWSSDLADLEAYLRNEFRVEYYNSTKDMFMIAFEDFFFRTNSKQLEMIVAKLVGKHIEIDVIGAGGKTGWLISWDWGSENAFIQRFKRIIETYKHERGIE